jgi:hypothetical protein
MDFRVPVRRQPLKVRLRLKMIADLERIAAEHNEKYETEFAASGEPRLTVSEVIEGLLEEAIPRRLGSLKRGRQAATRGASRGSKSLIDSAKSLAGGSHNGEIQPG